MGALSPRTRANAAGGDVPGGRGRLSRRHRCDRHGPQHGRRARRLRRAQQVRRSPQPPADRRRDGADRPARGRHQRDGTFGGVTEEGPGAFLPEEVFAIEEHRFPRIEQLYWRNGEPITPSIDALIASLERRPEPGVLLAAPQSTDLAVLKRLADEPWVRERARSPAMVKRLWAACGLPDFRKLGLDPHTTLRQPRVRLSQRRPRRRPQPVVRRRGDAARYDRRRCRDDRRRSRRFAAGPISRSAPTGSPIPPRGRNDAGDRGAAVRRAPRQLTQRFVDKRTTALIRQIGADASLLPVVIGAEGEVLVEDHAIGRLDGFRFKKPSTRRRARTDRRLLLAAAERHLSGERRRRGEALVAAEDAALAIEAMRCCGTPSRRAAAPGPSLARPQLRLDRDLDCLAKPLREAVAARGSRAGSRRCSTAMSRRWSRWPSGARDPQATPSAARRRRRAGGAGGLVPRLAIYEPVDALTADERKRLRRIGITIGTLDLFDPRLLKPAAARWRQTLLGVRGRGTVLPREGATVLPRGGLGAHSPPASARSPRRRARRPRRAIARQRA